MRLYFTKPVRILIIALLSTLLFVVVASTVVSVFYEKAVIRYMKKYMDEHLTTQVSMDEIRFSVLKGFPAATVEIDNVVMLSGDRFTSRDFHFDYADTLLVARKVTFRFNLIKLFHKDYSLKKIEITDGRFNYLIDAKGRNNLHIWKSDTIDNVKEYSVNLQSIVLTDLSFRWIDLAHHSNLSSIIRTASFKGNYTHGELSGNAHGNFADVTFTVHETKWVNHAGVLLQLNLLYGHDRFHIREGAVRLNKADISVRGVFETGNKPLADLELGIQKFGLAELISMMPAQQVNVFRDYRFTGKGGLKATLKGSLSDPDHLQISSVFNLADCSARNLKTRMNIRGINVTGTVSGTTSRNFVLQLRHFTATMGKGRLSGEMEVRDLHQFNMNARAHGDIDLSAFSEFLRMDTVEYLGGMVKADFVFNGSLGRLKADSAAHLLDYLKTGTFDFDHAGLSLKKSAISVRNITGKAVMNNSIYLDSVLLTLHENKLMVNGTLRNLTGYLLGKGILESELVVNTDNYSINYLLKGSDSGHSKEEPGTVRLLPARMKLKARLHSDGFDASRFRATDLTLTVLLAGDSLQIPSFSLRFGDGRISGNALIRQDSKHTVTIACNSVSKQIDIRELFTAFNNFAQGFIMDKNLKGQLNGAINFSSQWDSTLVFMPKSLVADAQIEIRDGELVQFEPMLKLSKYINVDELILIRFQTLKNNIHIQDRVVYIPEMAIHSSAFNIAASGHQDFDNLFEYRLNVLLSEVLFNKARKKKKEMNEFMVEDDLGSQTTIPLVIAGTPDNFDVKFDRKRAFSLTRQNLEKSSGKTRPAFNQTGVKIEWEEKEKGNTQPTVKKKEAKKEQQDDIQVEWDEDSKD